MSIALIPVDEKRRPNDEDWYIHVDGISRGYLYRSTNGYAVAIDVQGEIKHFGVEPSKDAALAFAKRHLS